MKKRQIEHIGTDKENGRELYVLELTAPDEIPQTFDTVGKYSTILIVWDGTDVSLDTISRLARRLIDAGAVYFCTWGPDCERIHDLIDEVAVTDTLISDTNATLMTTWHHDESLAEAIWYALYCALPNDLHPDECRSVIALCIGCPHWTAQVRSAFADSKRFSNNLMKTKK